IVRMVEEGRDGLAIAQQMQAVVKALEKAKTMVILDHIDNHLEAITGPLPREARARLAEFRAGTEYLLGPPSGRVARSGIISCNTRTRSIPGVTSISSSAPLTLKMSAEPGPLSG